jgi:hypothetical protein
MTNAYEIVEAGADVETQVVLVVHAAVKANFAGNTADKRRTGTAEICYRRKSVTAGKLVPKNFSRLFGVYVTSCYGVNTM